MLNNSKKINQIYQRICEFSKKHQSCNLINNLFNNLICTVIHFHLMLCRWYKVLRT